MVLGYLLVNYTSLADRKLTKQANAIVFKIFLPCMLFYNVYQSDIGAEIHSRIKLCIWAAGGLLILFVLLCLIVPKVVKQENQQGVVIQGIFRSNYVIFGVALAGEVKHQRCGAEGKPSLNRAKESVGADPKPGDLSMSRLKLP